MSIHVCGHGYRNLRKRYLRCPSCQCITEMVTQDGGYWGFEVMCCRCGDSWMDGERAERPFERGWRKKAIEQHRRMWDIATHGPDPTARELFPELLDSEAS